MTSYLFFFFFFCLFFFGAGIKPMASRMLGKRYATELHHSPSFLFFFLYFTSEIAKEKIAKIHSTDIHCALNVYQTTF
jgi:hypothetical protein